MELDATILIAATIKTGVWLFLLLQGVRLRLMKRFPLIYLFFVGKFIGFWIKTAALRTLGPDNPQYYWFFYGTNIPLDFLALLILLRIYYLPHEPAVKRDWPLLFVLPAVIALSFGEPMFLGYQIYYVIFFYQTIVGFLAATRLYFSNTVEIRSNLGGLLAGLTTPAALQTINQALIFVSVDFWSYDAFRIVNEWTTVICWCIIAYGMRRYDTPRRLTDAIDVNQVEAVSFLKRATKTLWRS